MFEARVSITLKKTVADPQGLTVKHALDSLGHKEADNVRVGKYLTLTLDVKDRKKAQAKLDDMCRQLLSNPIIEDYSFELSER